MSFTNTIKILKKHQKYVALIIVNSKDYNNFNLNLVKYFTKDKKQPGVYVTVNQPFATLKKKFKEAGINTELIIFIDAISNMVNKSLEDDEHCFYLDNPQDLSDISIAMSQAIDSINHKNKFVFLDSVSTLLVYNDNKTLIKFIHFLAGRIRDWNIEGILISLRDKKDRALIDKISQFCDVTINV